jgi:predicted alpha/beta superfamily hydrolase
MKTKLIFILLLIISCITINPCTVGVAIGKATADGRPLLWKTRDYEVKNNIVFYTQTDKYNFISDITPEYGFSKSWFGVNNRGFAIINTYIDDFPDGKNGPENGEFMFEALESCATVKEFQNLLDKTNISGRTTKAVFGVIDTVGGAAIFEVNANKYWMYDANDKNIAPNGYIVKTNFTIANGGTAGIERYNRSCILINEFYKGDSLNVKSILKYQMRDMADSAGMPITLNSGGASAGYFNFRKNICTPYSIAATVIQGVKQSEPAFLTTMWTMLGNPFTSIAIPYWPVGQSPYIAASNSDCSLFGISQHLKSLVFDQHDRNYANIARTKELRELLLQSEDSVYKAANDNLNRWRKSNPSYDEMLSIEKRFADYAYSKMLDIYTNWKTKYNGKANAGRIITLENFSDNGTFTGNRTIRIALPPNYFTSQEKYRVIYFFDGENAFSGEKDSSYLKSADYYRDRLLDEGLINPVILVAIHNNDNRFVELTPTKGICKSPGGKLEQFYNYINNILKPYIDSNFRTLKEPEFTGIAGHSLGGLSSVWLAYMHPETFGMAGCMGPSLWWDDETLLKKMADEEYDKTKPRFWFMSSDLEDPGMWINARRAAKILKDKGWVEGKNLAYYHVYGGNHNTQACNNQMRNMLYFLLRKEKPSLIGACIKNIKSSVVEPIDIESLGEYACTFLELQYTNGFRTNAINPDCKIEDTNIAAIEDNITGALIPKSAGWTTLNMKYQNLQASIPVKSFDVNNYEKLSITKSQVKVNIDGNLNDWESLRFSDKGSDTPSKAHFMFDLKYDDNYVYLAIKVIDDTVFIDTTRHSEKKDGITISFDGRPDPVRSLGRGLAEWNNFLPIVFSPGWTVDKMILQRDTFYGDKLPADLKAISIITKEGYNSEIAIPVSYMLDKQGKTWKEFRINICQNDIAGINGQIIKRWWQPGWDTKDNYNGSGTFKK